MQSAYSNTLSISSFAKTVPYSEAPSLQGGEGNNYGFKNLITSPDLLTSIPELQSDLALKALIRFLNCKESSFFTTGCFSQMIYERQGYHYRGYVELAWNCQNCIQDAIHYFSLFFHFEQFLQQEKDNPAAQFHWLIEETDFLDIDLAGFCCAILLTTDSYTESSQATDTWEYTLKTLGSFFAKIPTKTSSPIYTNNFSSLCNSFTQFQL
ncbi:MAG: hypothetical protein AAGG51_03625 [Cyanobacteria bacterium P01_G01_bin.54]